MGSTKKYLGIGLLALFIIVLFLGIMALSEPTIKGLSRDALLNQSNESDLIVSINERFINSILQSEIKERQPKGVDNITIFFNEGGPVEILIELQVSLGIVNPKAQIKVEANLSVENNTLKVDPQDIDVGKLNLPSRAWIGPIDTAITTAQEAANKAAGSALEKGFQITGVYIGDRYLTLTINVLQPQDLKKTLGKS
jgi:hypothetical protein